MEKLNILLKHLSTKLKTVGVQKKDNIFFVNMSNSWGIIEIQKSINSSKDQILFTMNIGICIKSIHQYLGGKIDRLPRLDNCQWKTRVGYLLPENKDYWWKIERDVDLVLLSSELFAIIQNVVLPQIERNSIENNLLEQWLNGVSLGLTDFERMIYLSTLLKINDDKKILDIVKELEIKSKGKNYEFRAINHLEKLGFR